MKKDIKMLTDDYLWWQKFREKIDKEVTYLEITKAKQL